MYGNEAELGGLFRSLGWGKERADVHITHTSELRPLPPRSEFFITSKVWATNLGEVGAALDHTLAATGLDYLDLYLIHWPVPLRSVGIVSASVAELLSWFVSLFIYSYRFIHLQICVYPPLFIAGSFRGNRLAPRRTG